jgi:hypothetical protein
MSVPSKMQTCDTVRMRRSSWLTIFQDADLCPLRKATRQAIDVISTGGTEFKFSGPKALFDARISGRPWGGFDVSEDGRFLMPIPVQQGFSVPI